MSYQVGAATEAQAGIIYTVVKDDTLDKIAKRYGTTYQELARINRIANPNKIDIGQLITIKEAVVPQPVVAAQAAPVQPVSAPVGSSPLVRALWVVGAVAPIGLVFYLAMKAPKTQREDVTA